MWTIGLLAVIPALVLVVAAALTPCADAWKSGRL
jgi:hypothetical protein